VVTLKMVGDAREARDRTPDSVVPWSYELTSQPAGPAATAATATDAQAVSKVFALRIA
jgi:hypothetical protein